MTSIAITGATGRMGKRLIALARESGNFQIIAGIIRPDHQLLGRDAGEIAGVGQIGVALTSELRATPQVLIDFTSASATQHWLDVCCERRIAMLIGTTGLDATAHAAIDRAAKQIPILQATNTSVGVALLNKLVAQAAAKFPQDYDVEIVESHHRFKKDAPSGTALSLKDSIEAGGQSRRRGEIVTHSLRVGDEIGTHTVSFAVPGERLELTHVATNRDAFAHGALRAAEWLAKQKPGRHQIGDVLGF